MQILLNTVGTIDGDDDQFSACCLSVHPSGRDRGTPPSMLLSVLLAADETWEGLEMRQTIVLTPDQARALAYGMLRMTDALEAAVLDGEWNDEAIPELPVYVNPPNL